MKRFLTTAVALLITAHLAADTIVLKNGNVLVGTIEKDERSTGGMLTLGVGKTGKLLFPAEQIAAIKRGPAPVPTTSADAVVVKISKGTNFYGAGTYTGTVSSKSDEKTLVLNVAGAGEVGIPRAAVLSMEKADPALKLSAATEKTIKTTHVVLMKTGLKLTGTLLPTAENEPLRLKIGGVGIMTIDRRLVESTTAQDGEILLPESVTPAIRKPEPKPEEVSPELLEKLKREARREILEALLEDLVSQQVGQLMEGPAIGKLTEAEQATLTGDELLEIQTHARELTRQRTRNRVRAERHLKSAGVVALAYIEPIAKHPFELTRRAVQRIVRDIGDLRGSSLAIDGLVDPDRYVRALAYEALKALYPGEAISYRVNGSAREIRATQKAYRDLWKQALTIHLQEVARS